MQIFATVLQLDVLNSGAKQVSEIDPDASLLCKSGKSVIGYNCQIAVEDKARLIVGTDRVQDGNDIHQLEPMMTKASEAIGTEELVGLADAGSANGDPLKGCEDRGMKMYVPLPDNAIRKGKDGSFGSAEFYDDKATDGYGCPVGRKLVHHGSPFTRRGKRYLMVRS